MRATLNPTDDSSEAAPLSTDLAVAQMLALAKAAEIEFDVSENRLLIRSARANWKLWPPVRHYLDELGVDAIIDYFNRNSPKERASLSSPA